VLLVRDWGFPSVSCRSFTFIILCRSGSFRSSVLAGVVLSLLSFKFLAGFWLSLSREVELLAWLLGF